MNYEKLYKEALERARVYHTGGSTIDVHITEVIFPELAESEDEKIRKELIEQIAFITPNNDELDDECDVLPTYQKRIDKYRTWLEKQREQKQTWEPDAAQLIVIKDLIKEENTSKVNKVILRGMLDEFKQYFKL